LESVIGNVLLILLFIIIGGVFAAAEMALVSLRDSQIRQFGEKGKRGRTVAQLSSDPNLFLSAVQIGVTLSGFLSAAFGGALLSDELAAVFAGWGMPLSAARPVALVSITLVISYFSIVIGELTSKRLAMQNAEAYSLALGPMVAAIAKIAKPVIWLLTVSTNVLVRLLGGNPAAGREEVTDDELRAMVESSATLGEEERAIVDEVFSAGNTSLREVMIPRTEVDFLDGSLSVLQAVAQTKELAHSRYPVIGETADEVLGFVHVRDFIALTPGQMREPVSALARPVTNLPQSVRVLKALSDLRANKATLAIVRDEYGGTAGIVTIEDLIEELIGDISDEFDAGQAEEVSLPGETTTIDGLLTLEDFADRFGYKLPQGPYDTVAGFVMALLGDLPTVGDKVEVEVPSVTSGAARFEFEVSELDGRRAARLRFTQLEEIVSPEQED
jgi:putative hemolysin